MSIGFIKINNIFYLIIVINKQLDLRLELRQYRIIEQERFVSKFCVLTRRGLLCEIATKSGHKISRKAPRQRDRSLRKEPQVQWCCLNYTR